MKSTGRSVAVLSLAVLFVLACAGVAGAAAPVNLGKSASYAVYAQHDLLNTGTSSLTGDLGMGPSGSPLPAGLVVSGATNWNNAESPGVLAAVRAAHADAMARSWDTTITGDLGGRTLLPGVYRASAADSGNFSLTGTLTLDAQGDPNAVWVFQATGDLNTRAGSRVVLKNGARFCRVFWAMRTADLGAASTFEGHILAAAHIDLNGAGTLVRGQLLAAYPVGMDGAILLDNTTVDNSICTTWTPSLPKTGYPPDRSRSGWPIPVGIVIAVSLIATAAARRRSLLSGTGDGR
jgi:hypothetical protein